MFPNVGHLYISASKDYPGWQDDIDGIEWLTFFRLLTTIEMLHVHGNLAGQVARALKDVPGKMVTKVLPSLHLLVFEDDKQVKPIEKFVSLRQVNGRPVKTINLQWYKT